MDVLVTGGAGFIGSFIVDELLRKGHSVTIFDNLDPQVHAGGRLPEYINKHAQFVHGDVRDYDALKDVVGKANAIFHKAAAVGVGQSQYEIKKYVDVNVSGTANLLDIIVNHPHKIEKLVVAASMSSYGEGLYHCATCGPMRPELRPAEQMAEGRWEQNCPNCSGLMSYAPTPETAYQHPSSIYAQTKKDQEDMVLNIGRTYQIPSVALRYFNAYGPRQSLSNPYTGVMAIFLSRLKNDRPPVIYEDGLQTRDFVSVHDIVQANMLALEKPGADYMSFNVASGIPIAISEIADRTARLLHKNIKPDITMKFRQGDIRHCIADISKIRNELGFEPRVSFEDGLTEVIDWSLKAEAQDLFENATAELRSKGLM
ncbi:MAG: SDR family NAD(P)-dependent oxidoreductase [Candidatus Latescibacteria bacterium]|jgi:dTDP-L-rhamnose 4-epimerase|nr:SDR family NAD(P)-dependent oxidoreductase [Candidatus Latescibacterota bacterium]